MVPDIAKAGHSFKGAMAYYLHDKRQDGQTAQPQTAERVQWTETRNLATDGPHTATRIMIATAQQAEQLKAAAGVKNTGRKSNAHVYAYSLAWHPDEAGQLDRAEMIRAADASLRALGASDRQAVIVCHRDRAHPHVHVIVNRVHPETGVMLSTSNDRRKLSAWANEYERERGQILTPKREEARQARELAKRDFARAARADSPRADPQPRRPQSEAAMLKELSDAQKVQHKQQWAELSARNKAERNRIYSDFTARMKSAQAKAWADSKANYARLREMSREEWRAHGRETFRAGRQIEKARLGVVGTLLLAWGHAAGRDARARDMAAAQTRRRDAVAADTRARIDREITALKEQRGRALSAQREKFDRERGELIETQNATRAKMREAWRQVYERRGKDPRYPARQQAAPRQEQKPMKRDFERSRAPELPATKYPTSRQAISQPAPAPSPAGLPTPAQRKIQDVPEVARKVDIAKPAPTAQRDFGASADKPLTRAEYWNQKAKEKAPEPARDRSRDRDFDRER